MVVDVRSFQNVYNYVENPEIPTDLASPLARTLLRRLKANMFRDGTRKVRAPLRKASSSVSRCKAKSLPDPSDETLQHCQTWQAAEEL